MTVTTANKAMANLRSIHTDWNAFFETVDDTGDDQLYVQGNGELANFHTILRPHGNNHWGDRISQVKVGLAPPAGLVTENSTVLYHGRRDYADNHGPLKQLNGSNPNWGT